MEALAALLGIGVAAAAPFVPGLRPVAKAVVKGGLAVASATASAAALIAEEVSDLAAHVRADPSAEVEVSAEAADVPAAPAAEEPGAAAGAGGLSAPGLRPVTKAAVKGSLAVADAAKVAAGAAAGAAAVAGKQVGALAASVRAEKPAEEPVVEDAAPDEPAASLGATDETSAAAQPADAPREPDDLTRVAGIGPKTAAMLQAAGIASFAQLAATPVEQLRAILDQGGPQYRVTDPTTWPAKAQAILDAPPPAPKPFDDNDLVQIDGIGPKIADLLRNAGISTVSQLAVTPVEHLREILVQAGARYRITDPTPWPAQAQALLAGH